MSGQPRKLREQQSVQPVDEPILCNPYEEPDDHWDYDQKTGAAAPPGGLPID